MPEDPRPRTMTAPIVSGPVTCCSHDPRERMTKLPPQSLIVPEDPSRSIDDSLTRLGDPANHSRGLGHDSYSCTVTRNAHPTVLRVSLDDGATLPTRNHSTDAGLDLYPLSGALVRLMPHETRTFDTGVHVEIPPGYYGKIEGRSGLAARAITPGGGVIDSSYRGSIGVVLTNHGQAQWVAQPGKAIAQLVLIPISTPAVMVVGSLGATERGDNGFGSSDGKGAKS